MHEETCNVGDMVAWDEVPSGSLVRDSEGDYAVNKRRRKRHVGTWVGVCEQWVQWTGNWSWVSSGRSVRGPVTIIALGLTGHETADELRRLAEVFEVREALPRAVIIGNGVRRTCVVALAGKVLAHHWCGEQARTVAAERLHAAGWRPGMTAEDAARLLREAGAP